MIPISITLFTPGSTVGGRCRLPALEMTWHPLEEIRDGIWNIWKAMQECAARGLITRGTLPSGLEAQRRAAEMARRLENKLCRSAGRDGLAQRLGHRRQRRKRCGWPCRDRSNKRRRWNYSLFALSGCARLTSDFDK